MLIISKMQIKSLGCNPKVAAVKEEGDKSAVDLCTIVGNASEVKFGEDGTGKPFSVLCGEFEGRNIQVGSAAFGNVYSSGKLFLPGGIHDRVEQAVRSLGDKGGSVQFALKLQAIRASNPIGYSYQAEELMQPSAVDSLSELRKLLPDAAPASPRNIEAPAPMSENKPEVKHAAVAVGHKK